MLGHLLKTANEKNGGGVFSGLWAQLASYAKQFTPEMRVHVPP